MINCEVSMLIDVIQIGLLANAAVIGAIAAVKFKKDEKKIAQK